MFNFNYWPRLFLVCVCFALETRRNSEAGEVICPISTGDVSRSEEGMGSQILHECVRPGQKAKGADFARDESGEK